MDSVTQSYSVLLVSASAKFMDSVLPLLPERSFFAHHEGPGRFKRPAMSFGAQL